MDRPDRGGASGRGARGRPGRRGAPERFPGLDRAERDFMFAGLDRLAGEVDAEGPRGVGLIHADPAPRRVLRRPDGGAALTAWGHAAVGPRVWDVATVAVHARRFHQHDPTTWARFRVGYGDDDLVESARFGRWCARRESAIIADDARGAGPGSPALREIRRRIGELRDRDGARGPTERHWRSV